MIKKFTTNLHVDTNIVSLLSTSTYQKSFSSAIRELVSNSYDADSLSVFITISKDFKTIEIEDDGNGMNQKEFEKYLTIAGSKSENPLQVSRKYKRKKIGQFGVGFLSVFPFCEALEITTTTENSEEIIFARIPAIEYSNRQKTLVEDIEIKGSIIVDKSQTLKKYTKIKLVNPTYNVEQYFSPPTNTKKKDTILVRPPFEKFQWELQEDLPLDYKNSHEKENTLKYSETIGMNVFLNGDPIYRNDLRSVVLESGTKIISGIECSYIFTTDYNSIKPMEARGIKRRVNNVGIGPRTDFELKRDRGFSRLHWISGEIHYSEQIKAYLTLSRDGFVKSVVTDELDDFFASKLKEWAYYVENVAVSEKEIEQTINDTKKGRTSSKEELIQSNLKKLEDRGFEIVRKTDSEMADITDSTEPIQIDKANKRVIVRELAQFDAEYETILGKSYEIRYSKDFPDDAPCRFLSAKVIEINQNYPFYKSKSHGNLFKKLHIMLLVNEKVSKSPNEFYNNIVDNFDEHFEDFK